MPDSISVEFDARPRSRRLPHVHIRCRAGPQPQTARSRRPSQQGPTFIADTVLGRDGFLVGAEASYNVTEGRVTKYATAIGYSAPEYAVTLHGLGNLSTFAASYYHRVSPDVEAGAKAIYDTKAAGNVSLEVGAKAYLDSAAFVKAKINNTGILSLGYTQALRPGVKASFGLALDTQKLNDISPEGPAHKVGFIAILRASCILIRGFVLIGRREHHLRGLSS